MRFVVTRRALTSSVTVSAATFGKVVERGNNFATYYADMMKAAKNYSLGEDLRLRLRVQVSHDVVYAQLFSFLCKGAFQLKLIFIRYCLGSY